MSLQIYSVKPLALVVVWLVAMMVTGATSSIYDVLELHGLPIGLLPKGVKEFRINDDGFFEAHLDQTCRSKLDNQFEYKRDISGRMSYGRVGNLTGMESLELFVWVQVNGIRVDIPNSGRIHFDLEKGVRKELSLSLFETPADCVAVSHLHPHPQEFDITSSVVDNRVFKADKKLGSILKSRRFGQKRSERAIM